MHALRGHLVHLGLPVDVVEDLRHVRRLGLLLAEPLARLLLLKRDVAADSRVVVTHLAQRLGTRVDLLLQRVGLGEERVRALRERIQQGAPSCLSSS